MMKYLLKLLMPNAKTISNMVADTIAKQINELNREEQISKYAKYADDWTKIQDKIVKLLADGKIDDEEKKQISTMIEPIATKILEAI